MRIAALVNQKGGTGKTTSAVNLAAAFAERGRRVLLVDLDQQATASRWLLEEEPAAGVGAAFFQGQPLGALILEETTAPGVCLIPASADLAAADKALAGEPGAEAILRAGLETLQGFDLVLIDCPPGLGIMSLNALVAASEAWVPAEPAAASLWGLSALEDTIERVHTRLNPHLELSAVLLCRARARVRLVDEVTAALRERYGAKLLQTTIPETVRLAEAVGYRRPVTVYDSNGKGAEAYRAAAAELDKGHKAKGAKA